MKVELVLGVSLLRCGGISQTCLSPDGPNKRGPKELGSIDSNIRGPIWAAEISVEASGGGITKVSIGAFAVARSLAPHDPGLAPKATPPEVLFVSS